MSDPAVADALGISGDCVARPLPWRGAVRRGRFRRGRETRTAEAASAVRPPPLLRWRHIKNRPALGGEGGATFISMGGERMGTCVPVSDPPGGRGIANATERQLRQWGASGVRRSASCWRGSEAGTHIPILSPPILMNVTPPPSTCLTVIW